MEGVVAAGILQGLALGGVLAAAAGWSRVVRAGPLPHLGVGALAGVGIALGVRLAAAPGPLAFLLVVAGGAVLGRLALALDARVGHDGQAPDALADAAVLAAAVAIVGALVPLRATPPGFPPFFAGALATGAAPLGGTAGTVGALAALAIGVGGGLALVSPRFERLVPGGLTPERRWTFAGAAVAGSAVLGGGVLAVTDPAVHAAALAVADPVGLALRTAAAALAGRGSAGEAVGAGLGLGLAEALVRGIDPTGATILLPTFGVALLGVLLGWRRAAAPAAAGR